MSSDVIYKAVVGNWKYKKFDHLKVELENIESDIRSVVCIYNNGDHYSYRDICMYV